MCSSKNIVNQLQLVACKQIADRHNFNISKYCSLISSSPKPGPPIIFTAEEIWKNEVFPIHSRFYYQIWKVPENQKVQAAHDNTPPSPTSGKEGKR